MQPNPLNRLGSGSKGPVNNYSALKYHPFFEGIDFDIIAFKNPPGLSNLKEIMNCAKSMKMMTLEQQNKTNKSSTENNNSYNKSTDDSVNLNLDCPFIRIIKEGILKKKVLGFITIQEKSFLILLLRLNI